MNVKLVDISTQMRSNMQVKSLFIIFEGISNRDFLIEIKDSDI